MMRDLRSNSARFPGFNCSPHQLLFPKRPANFAADSTKNYSPCSVRFVWRSFDKAANRHF